MSTTRDLFDGAALKNGAIFACGDGGSAGGTADLLDVNTMKAREPSSAVERCGPHVAISPAMLRPSNGLT